MTRSFRFHQPSRREGGWTVLVLLIVVVIILVVMMTGPAKTTTSDTKGQVLQAVNSIDRSKVSTCAANRRAIETNLTNYRILNDNKLPPVDQLRMTISERCPGKGGYLIGPDFAVYCTEHFPPPIDQLKQMISLSQPIIETPIPLPEATPMQ
jgi:hypothetical protein